MTFWMNADDGYLLCTIEDVVCWRITEKLRDHDVIFDYGDNTDCRAVEIIAMNYAKLRHVLVFNDDLLALR